MSITKLRGKTQIKELSIDLGRLEQDFLKGADWNITNGAKNATITGLKAGVNAADAVNKEQLDALAASMSSGLRYMGLIDASTPAPDLDAIDNLKGDFYKVSVAGTIGGLFPDSLNVGDMLIVNKAVPAATVITAADIDVIDNTEAVDIIRLSDIIDNVSSTDATKALSAKQGKILKDLIDVEVAARISAVSNEASARQSGDTALQGSIASEVSAREAADVVVQASVDAEVAARILAVDAVQDALDAEVIARGVAEGTLQANIAAEAASRAASDTALQAAIDSEAAARGAAYTAVQNSLAAEVSARQAADVTINENITSETSARTSADATLQANIAAEASSRVAGDSALQSAIDAEVAARVAAILAIQNTISAMPTEVNEECPTVTAGQSIVSALAHTPVAGSVKAYLNGVRQRTGASNDFTIAGAVINFTFNLEAGDVVLVDYKY